MQYLFTAPSLTKPTFETLETYTKKRFRKIERLIPGRISVEATLRISVQKDGDQFALTVEISLHNGEDILVKEKDRDLRRAIDLSAEQLKQKMSKDKAKRIDLRKMRSNMRDAIRTRIFGQLEE